MSLNILVVDDSRAMVAIISRSILGGDLGDTQVTSAVNAEAALAMLEQQRPDLLITDWHMPGMSGLGLLQTVRQIYGPSLPVGMITTEMSPELLRQAEVSGVSFVVHKPFKDAELLNAVRRALPVRELALAGDGEDTLAAHPPAPSQPPPPPAPAETPAVVPLGTQLRQQVASRLGAIKFRIVENEPIVQAAMSPKVLAALYGLPGRKAAFALAVLDMSAVCMVGGGCLGLPPNVVRPAIAAQSATAPMLEAVNEFLREAGQLLAPPDSPAPKLVRCTVVAREMDKLREALAKHSRLEGFRLQVPGYGEGRLAFIVL